MPDTAMRKVLVFGSTGQVGHALRHTEWPRGITPLFLGRDAADFARPDMAATRVKEHAPDAIIITAAYTDVDAAESDEATSMAVNAVAPGAIARAAAALSIPVIYISTDYVFDGRKPDRYVEDDAVGPINAYGRSKLAGEIEIRAGNPRHLILRTSWVYGAVGTNFLRSMLRLADERDEVEIVADQVGCPTAAEDFAAALARLAPRLFKADMRWGTYHLAGRSEISWHGFAELIFSELAKRGIKRPTNRAITTADFPRPASSPANSRLSSEAFRRTFGTTLPGYESTVPRVLDALLAGSKQEEENLTS